MPLRMVVPIAHLITRARHVAHGSKEGPGRLSRPGPPPPIGYRQSLCLRATWYFTPIPVVQTADANALFPATRLVSWLKLLVTTAGAHVPRPSRTDASTAGPLAQATAVIEPSRAAARLGDARRAARSQAGGCPPTGAGRARGRTDGCHSAGRVVHCPDRRDVARCVGGDRVWTDKAGRLDKRRAAPRATDGPCRGIDRRALLPEGCRVARSIERHSWQRRPPVTGETAVAALQLPPAGRVADST